MSSAQNIKVKRDDERWEVEVKAEIPAEALTTFRAQALKEIQKTAKLDGFRPGKAPESEIVRIYGEAAVLREAAELAIQHELPEILAKEQLLVIDAPRVETAAPKTGKALSFTARAPLAPKVELPDYKKIGTKHSANQEEIVISEQEYAEATTHLRRERARIEKMETGAQAEEAAKAAREMEEKELPALDDDFAKSIGYESAAHFADTLRLNMKEEKTRQMIDKRRSAILDELIGSSKISYPAMLREYELDDMEHRLKDDVTRMGSNLDAYLAEAKKTREQLRAEWKDAADKRAKVRLVLAHIGRLESIEPDPAALAQEVERAKKHYPQADAEVLRTHIAHAMRNEAVLKFLETRGL
jgi:FKBP-type peptidyl-prolyl cis-trans isomerase (trigger factor)